ADRVIEARRQPGSGGRTERTAAGRHGPADHGAPLPVRLVDRRDSGNTGDARLLRGAWHRLRYRAHADPEDQRSLPAHPEGGREVPVRDRSGVARDVDHTKRWAGLEARPTVSGREPGGWRPRLPAPADR